MTWPADESRPRTAARAALDHRAADLLILDVRGLSGIADWFLVCSGHSTAHVEAITEAVRLALKGDGVQPRHAEGTASSGWVLLDYGDLLVHVFLEETRRYYGLERLWGDAPELGGLA